MNVGTRPVTLADDIERRRLAVLRRIVGAGRGTAVGEGSGTAVYTGMRQPTSAGPVHATPALRMALAQQREAPPGCAPHPLPPQLPSHSASPPQQALPFAVPSEHHSSDIAWPVGAGRGTGVGTTGMRQPTSAGTVGA